VVVAVGVVPDSEGAEAPLRDVLAAALEANQEMARLAAELREENARLRAENGEQAAELERLRADLAVFQRMLFGRSSERSRPERAAGGDGGGEQEPGRERGNGTGGKRGPGARAGRRDYSHLPRFKVVWDFPGGGYCCPRCGVPFTLLGDHVSEQLDWLVIVRVRADCRRRYRRACSCRVPATVMAPGPPKAIGKGLFSNGFTAMLFVERFAAGRSMNSLVSGLARQGADISPATLAGTCAQAGALLAPLAEAITARSRDSWHLHADETSWRVFAPREGDGPAKWWLWVFIGPDTVCFVMDPTRSGAVLARHASIDEDTGQLTRNGDESGPRRLVISSDFYAVYQSAGKKADGLVNLYCWAQYAEPGIMRNGAAGWPGLLAVAGLVQLPGAGSSA
jgi:transposase